MCKQKPTPAEANNSCFKIRNLLLQGKQCSKMFSRRVKSGLCLVHRGGDVKQGRSLSYIDNLVLFISIGKLLKHLVCV